MIQDAFDVEIKAAKLNQGSAKFKTWQYKWSETVISWKLILLNYWVMVEKPKFCLLRFYTFYKCYWREHIFNNLLIIFLMNNWLFILFSVRIKWKMSNAVSQSVRWCLHIACFVQTKYLKYSLNYYILYSKHHICMERLKPETGWSFCLQNYFFHVNLRNN